MDLLFLEMLETDSFTHTDSVPHALIGLSRKTAFETRTDTQAEKTEALLNLYTSEFYTEVKKAFEMGCRIGARFVLEIST